MSFASLAFRLVSDQESKISESQKLQLPIWLAYPVLYSFVSALTQGSN